MPVGPDLNYTNPMSIMTLGALRTIHQPFVGLCHSVQGPYYRKRKDLLKLQDIPS